MNHNSSAQPNHFESLYPPDSRFSEVEKVFSFIKSGNSVQLISLPGVGRSNILGLLAYNRDARLLHLGQDQTKFHFVMMNFSEIKGRNLAEATKYIFLELFESIKERKIKEFGAVKKMFDETIKQDNELLIFQGLKKTIDYLCLQNELTVVFLFDRFEEYIPMLTPQFFGNLRVLRDRAKYRFSAVFPINRPLEETLGHEILAPFYEFIEGNLVYLPINDQKMLDFRISYLEERNGKKIDKKVLSEILDLTGGHGKLTRVVIEEFFSSGGVSSLVNKQKVKAVLSEIWQSFTPFEQSLIEAGKANESAHLITLGLIKDGKIAIPLLESFANDEKQKTKSKISFDVGENKIRKGDLVLSDGLTNSEFKLLKFMALNSDRVLTRDEIIGSVWGELSSTAGVTEQALDQLIFRLRKKIEENPNSPTHIQTVKGRGFKFTP